MALSELMTKGPADLRTRHPADRGGAQDARPRRLVHHRDRRPDGPRHPDDRRHHLSRRSRGAPPPETPVAEVMTPDPITLPPGALVADVLHTMVERGITHIARGRGRPPCRHPDPDRPDPVSGDLLGGPDPRHHGGARQRDPLRKPPGASPICWVQLVSAQNPHQVVTRLITDIGDAITRRLLALAEAQLGPPPVPYLWLACGSQGRQEQTGVSDQDNCLILDDAATPPDDEYFAALAKYVSDGLDEAGYFYCPGDMMATNIKWRQPLRVWRQYFRGWINTPNPEAQMLASVMFDLRPIGGTTSLFSDLQAETLAAAREELDLRLSHDRQFGSSITRRWDCSAASPRCARASNKNTIDLKHNGVVPVVDLGRIYALKGQLAEANTPAPRILAGIEAGRGLDLGGARPSRRLRHDRRHPPRPPGRPDQARREARQFHGARRSLRFRAQPPSRRLRRHQDHAECRRLGPRASELKRIPHVLDPRHRFSSQVLRGAGHRLAAEVHHAQETAHGDRPDLRRPHDDRRDRGAGIRLV